MVKQAVSQAPFRGDMEDYIELQQLLSAPHRILYEGTSKYQNILVLESKNIQMYVNRLLQFNSMDERMYHEAMVHPAMALTPMRKRVLCVGSSDGLMIREVLKYADVERIDVIGVTPEVVRAVKQVPQMNALNERAFFNKRVHIMKQDIEAFLAEKHAPYNVIIVDFFEPKNKQISRMYAKEIFGGFLRLLTDDGIMVCQSHSPSKAPQLFWSIARTLESAGFKTLSYHLTVPSFGDWGFHLAAKKPLVWRKTKISVPHRTLPNDLSSWFTFPKKVLSARDRAPVNTLDHPVLHKYYARAQSLPTSKLIALSDLDDYGDSDSAQKISGDTDDLIELQQLLSGPHRILKQGNYGGDEVFIIESKDVRMYLDQQLQFSSLDERIYHEALVHPAMTLIPKRDRILIVGGGDGLALREVLKYKDVKHVDLVDIDAMVLDVAKKVKQVAALNEHSLSDKRVSVHHQDAGVFLSKNKNRYNAIIVDFPDPADKTISQLYTAEFFRRMFQCVTPDGVLVCQSHSPVSAPTVYWSIRNTLRSIGLKTLSYHVNVPSFGDWGFHLAAHKPLKWGQRKVSVRNETIPEKLASWFVFPKPILSVRRRAKANTQSKLRLYKFYRKEVGQGSREEMRHG